jgi:SNARE protein
LRNRLVRAKQVHRSIIVEIRSVSAAISAEYEAKARQFDERITKLTQDVEWAETTANKAGASGPPAVKQKSCSRLIRL